MSIKTQLIIAIAVFASVSGFAAPTPDAMRAASAVQTNTKYSSCISLTRDASGNIVSFHVNGVCPEDVGTLLKKDTTPLTGEFTIISGINKDGAVSSYMLPSSIATAQVVESISRDLVNAGSVNIQITKQTNGKT